MTTCPDINDQGFYCDRDKSKPSPSQEAKKSARKNNNAAFTVDRTGSGARIIEIGDPKPEKS